MLLKTFSATIFGINTIIITIEVSVSAGAKIHLVGLPDNAVKESNIRIETALKSIGLKIPGKKIVINMAPADIKKEGSAYDTAIAIGILAASEQIKSKELNQYIIMGELSLDGTLLPIKGALPIAIEARKQGFKGFILPENNAEEAAIVSDLEVLGAKNIKDIVKHFNGEQNLKASTISTREEFSNAQKNKTHDFKDVRGQQNIKRALEIAAAGGHNLLLIGPPGAGKTMLAKRLPSILPPMNLSEALETTKIHSIAGKGKHQRGLVAERPFQSPHHTISNVALVGGGSYPQPGEISLAHNGVLFLDELPEFQRNVLEVLRQPLEERIVNVSRASFSVDYPANIMLIASMNPCPCGFYNHPKKECICGPGVVKKYLNKVSGPLMDRIDLHVEVTPVEFNEMIKTEKEESSEEIQKRVIQARSLQEERFKTKENTHCNAMIDSANKSLEFTPEDQAFHLLQTAMDKLQLSARAYDRILKVARTIADLDDTKKIASKHIAEAIQYRSLDRENWGD